MSNANADVVFTPAVKRVQERKGSRAAYARAEEKGRWKQTVTRDLAQFIARRDSFYLATASAEGQPYIQHRGGRPGFLKVLDARTLAFADLRGNRQYITTGNLSENDKAAIFLMDYARQRRIKIWGRARVVDDDPDLLARLTAPEDEHAAEQVIVFEVAAWDVNCPQHITRRYTEAEVEEIVAPLMRRILQLEAQLGGTTSVDASIAQSPQWPHGP
jgi:predicted pyridoxine 5'-phosphate oxidase superfamily flavin-nucleotide-binding protein